MIGQIAGRMLSAEEIDALVVSGEAFGFALLPGESEPCGVLEAGRWLAPYAERVTPSSVGRRSVSPRPPKSPNRVDEKSRYIANVTRVIESCAARSGKTVFSREITGSVGDGVTPGRVFHMLSDRFPDTFRYIFNLPGEGVWIGATPEILLDVDLIDGNFSTMALAGTRRAPSDPTPWDEKNIREHRYVSDFIADALRGAGVSFSESEVQSLPYGDIEHLCRYFRGNLGDVPYSAVLDLLNPTPALCGTPKEAAIADIGRFEPHDREFYGGFIAVKTPKRFAAYANLRCLKISGNRYSVYAGGGITPLSDPYAEYLETEAKAAPRLALLRLNLS